MIYLKKVVCSHAATKNKYLLIYESHWHYTPYLGISHLNDGVQHCVRNKLGLALVNPRSQILPRTAEDGTSLN